VGKDEKRQGAKGRELDSNIIYEYNARYKYGEVEEG